MVVLFAAVGVSGSGKTTALEYLISQLTREGYKVGAIKHIHRENFTIDREGSNTWRFSKAGSKVTVAISHDEIAIIKKTHASLDDLDRLIKQLDQEELDVVFIEGFHAAISKRTDIFKILTAKTFEDLNNTVKGAVPPIIAITGVIAKNKPAQGAIPYVDLPEDGARLLELVKKHLTSMKEDNRQEN